MLQSLMDTMYGDQIEIDLHGDLRVPEWKANKKQFGYIHAVLFPHTAIAYRQAGWRGFDEYDAKFKLKQMFFSIEKVNEDTGEVFRVPRSLSEADHDEMSDFISNSVEFVLEVFGYEIPDSTEYKKMKRKQQKL